MSENDVSKTAMQIAASLATEIYKDGAKPAILTVGETLNGIFKAISHYPRYWGIMSDISLEEKQKRFRKTMEDKFARIPENHRILPKPSILGPSVQALEYAIFEDDVSEMFANLLTSASNSGKASKAHPAFVEIIKQITSEEARLIADYSEDWINGEFPQNLPIEKIYIHAEAWNHSAYDFSSPIDVSGLRLIQLEDIKPRNVDSDYSLVGYVYPKSYAANGIIASINNLERLGLIRFEPDYREVISGNSMGIYKSQILAKFRKNPMHVIDEEEPKGMDYEVAYLTRLGRNFVDTCVSEKGENS